MSEKNENGESGMNMAGLSMEDKIDLIVEGLVELNEKYDEIIEKLSNVSLPGAGYDIEEFDS